MSLVEAGCPAIYPVNPKYTEVLGLPCYPNLQSIPGIVDHVVVSIPADSVMALLDDCAAKGVKSVQFFTAGFSESGYPERAKLEQAMLKRAREAGFRIIGPNCVGLFVPKNGLVNTNGVSFEPGPIAFISQSGGHANNIVQFSDQRGLRFSKVVSYGNGLDVNEIELLEYFSQDPETEIIAVYIEGVKDGRRFITALKEAANLKPVVIYKGGRTEAGKRAAFGHTASMTTSTAVFDALCHQMKAIQVDDLDEMIDVITALRFINPLPKGSGVAIIGAGGGPSVLGGDVMEKEGLCLPKLSLESQAMLKQVLPVDGSIFTNPLDTPNMSSPEAVSKAMSIIGRIPEIHMIVYHLGFHPISRWGINQFMSESFQKRLVDSLSDARQVIGKPILPALRPPMDPTGLEEFVGVQTALVKAGFPVFYSLDKLAKAMSRVIAWNQTRDR